MIEKFTQGDGVVSLCIVGKTGEPRNERNLIMTPTQYANLCRRMSLLVTPQTYEPDAFGDDFAHPDLEHIDILIGASVAGETSHVLDALINVGNLHGPIAALAVAHYLEHRTVLTPRDDDTVPVRVLHGREIPSKYINMYENPFIKMM